MANWQSFGGRFKKRPYKLFGSVLFEEGDAAGDEVVEVFAPEEAVAQEGEVYHLLDEGLPGGKLFDDGLLLFAGGGDGFLEVGEIGRAHV